jgi:RNA polymerase sigma-70 factor (ECF subfamily)
MLSGAEVLNACLESGSNAAWTEFVRRFQPLVASVILRTARRYREPRPELVDDLVQETFLRLCRDDCKVLRQFESRHEDAIFGFLKVVAASVAMDHFRYRGAKKRFGEVPDESGTLIDTIATSSTDVENKLLLNETAVLLERVTQSKRDRTIFWLYYQQGFTAKEIAQLPGIELSVKGIESCIYRLTQAIRQEFNLNNPQNATRTAGVRLDPPLGELR